MVDVSSQNNSVSINVSSGGNSASIKATPDMAQYYSEKSREWAISNRIVDNIDYSSKYYAEKSKESEAKAENYERSVIEKYNSFVEVSNQAEAELQTLRDDSISQINTVTSSGISDIANKTSEAVTEINAKKETATNELNNAKNSAVTQLSKEAQEQLKNIESTGFYMRDDKLYFINSQGEEEEFKSGGSGFDLFDTRITDHILADKEAKGWALQGTYVTKDLYPDFYNKCLEEFKNKNTVVATPNMNIEGSLTNNNGVISGFSASNYGYINKIPTNVSTFEIMFKVTTGTNITTHNSIFGQISGNYTSPQISPADMTTSGLNFGYSQDGSTWGTGLNIVPANVISTNTTYWIKIIWDGSTLYASYSLNGTDWVDNHSVTHVAKIVWTTELAIGLDYYNSQDKGWKGSIDLNECYIDINGERWWSGGLTYKNPNGHQFYPISQKSVIDNIYNQKGIADFYGIDEENERIFLPRNKYFAIQGIAPVAGNGTTLGLTDGTNNYGAIVASGSGVSGRTTAYGESVGGAGGTENMAIKIVGITTDPTKSGIEAKLTPNETKYLYYCVGNTEVTSAITNITEITTSENDSNPLGSSFYFSNIQPNAGWLKSTGQFNDGNIYKTFYNWLVEEKTTNTLRSDIKDVLQEYSDYDYVLNQDEMIFRLPLLNGSETIPDHSNTITLDDGVEYEAQRNGFVYVSRSTAAGNYATSAQIIINGTTYDVQYYNNSAGQNTSSLFIPVKKGDVYKIVNTISGSPRLFISAVAVGNLYFKVANAVQNLELLDAGEVLEGLANKADTDLSNTNPSQKFVSNAISWLMPDYTAGVSLANSTYTATYPCLFCCHNYNSTVKVNGSIVGYGGSTVNVQVFLSIGDVVTGATTANGMIYPLKGAK